MLIEFARKDFITKKIVTGEFPTENCHHEIAKWKITPGKLLLREFPYGILPLSDPPPPPLDNVVNSPPFPNGSFLFLKDHCYF